MIELSIVIPIYNEKETLPLLYQRLEQVIPNLKKELYENNSDINDADIYVEVLFINDGSNDDSLSFLKSIASKNNTYRYISFSRNFGHQAAVSAGLRYARGKLVVVMDGDLQDPPEIIKDLIRKRREGFEVVYVVRRKRKAAFLKKIAYKFYYIFNSLISDQPIQKDSGDFCLLDRKIVDIINKLPEKEKYLRGLRAWVGFKQIAIPHDRIERKMGKTKYSLNALTKLAFSGILSTSVKPLLITGFFCIVSMLIIFAVIAYVLISKMCLQSESIPTGWASLMITVSALSGLQFFSLWILSLYMAKIYREILSRPTYLIEEDVPELKN